MNATDQARLHARAYDSLTELVELRSAGPMPAAMIRAIRLTEHTLRHHWLPLLAEHPDHCDPTGLGTDR